MGRKAPRITMEEFKEIVEARRTDKENECHHGPFDIYELPAKIDKDLGKVTIDGENQYWEQDATWFGYHMIGDLPVLGASAGGDWEWPVYFIIYWDGKQLRGYIPKKGNMWNYKTKEAFGNDDEEDAKVLQKLLKEKYGRDYDLEHCSAHDVHVDLLMLDIGAMEKDILERIEVQ